MNILKLFIFVGVVFFNYNFAKAASIPYCSKTVTKGCVKSKQFHSSKYYITPHYMASHNSHGKVSKSKSSHVVAKTHTKNVHGKKPVTFAKSNKFKSVKSKSKKVAKNTFNKKSVKAKRGTASVASAKSKKTKKKKTY